MLYYDRINVSEEININKTKASKQFAACQYQCFLDKGFKFQPYAFKGCHNVLIMSMSISNIAILNIKSAYYRCIISGISNSKAVHLLKNADLTEKSGTL